MTLLEPLASSSGNVHTRALLRAGQNDGPPEDFEAKLLVGLGVVSSTMGVALSASAGTVASGAAKTSAGGALWLVAAKWVAVGAVGGGILASGVSHVLSPTPVVATTTTAVQPAAAPPLVKSVSEQVALPSLPNVARPASVDSPRALESAEPEATPSKVGAAPPSARIAMASGQLGREVAQFDRARAALTAGEAARALSLLDDFDRMARTGVLDREARVLRVDALERLGRVAEARVQAERFLQIYPHDPHATRLRTLQAKSP